MCHGCFQERNSDKVGLLITNLPGIKRVILATLPFPSPARVCHCKYSSPDITRYNQDAFLLYFRSCHSPMATQGLSRPLFQSSKSRPLVEWTFRAISSHPNFCHMEQPQDHRQGLSKGTSTPPETFVPQANTMFSIARMALSAPLLYLLVARRSFSLKPTFTGSLPRAIKS
jgi:hypothetical protein